MFEKDAEKIFVESYPEFCCNEKPISPYWDLWEAGTEFGYNKALEDTETMLKVLKDRGIISSWYYNGSYHIGNELPR